MNDMNEDYFEKAIDWAKKHGFSNIKANLEEYEKARKSFDILIDLPDDIL